MSIAALGVLSSLLFADSRTIPPSVSSVTPQGLKRGSTVILTIEGRSLAGARVVLFDAPGLTGKILAVSDVPEKKQQAKSEADTEAEIPQGPKQQARVEITATRDLEAGLHRFRIETPSGTSNLRMLDVGDLSEIRETEPNDGLEKSQGVTLPATLIGTVGWPGDVDSYSFEGRASEELVFQVVASSLGSELKSTLTLQDATGQVLARTGEYSRRMDAVLTAKLPADGKYTISIMDLERQGGTNYFYRLNAGALPYVTEIFPLGVRAGESSEVWVKGVNLGTIEKVSMQAPRHPQAGWNTIPLCVKTPHGETLNKVMVAVGEEPEVMEREPNDSPRHAQRVTIPVTINGRVRGTKKGAPADEDYFRFEAKKGEHLTLEVDAARLGSPLDSVLEVLDAQGNGLTSATVRSLVETALTLSDRDSKSPGFRLVSLAGIHPFDYLMMGEELVQITRIPEQPDDDLQVMSYGGERVPLVNTSPEAHAINTPVYKVNIFKPGVGFPPNGLPLFHLSYRNDDGGPGYGSDSRVNFVAPEDGEYLAHIKDVRGLQGENFAYRLTIREAEPDFTLTARPANPNVPRGGRVPVSVEADRRPGYEGPIKVEVRGLPPDITASPATIPAGQISTVVMLSASPDAPLTQQGAPFQIVGVSVAADEAGRKKVEESELVRVADPMQPLRVVSVMPPPDVVVTTEPHELALEAGKRSSLTLRVHRRNGFEGRLLFNVMNLPPGVFVADIGFTGVIVTEKEDSRTLVLRAEDWVPATQQPIYVVGTVESSSPTEHTAPPLILKVQAKTELARASQEGTSLHR